MDSPLITEASSSGGAGAGAGYHKHKPYQRRSDAIAYGTRYQKAAALVDLAEDGIGLPEEVLNDSSFDRAAKLYFIYIRFDWVWSLNLFALLLLNFLEKPLWCSTSYDQYACQDREYFFLGQLPYLNNVQSLIYEGITLSILILHTFFPIAYEGFHLYWKSPSNRIKVVLLLLLICDMLIYALYVSPVLLAYLPLRIAPYVRVIFVIMTIRDLRGCIVTIAGMMGMYLNVLALSLLFLLFASWLAYVTFEDTLQGKTMFSSYGATLYQMFVLFTTSNNPDVWIPAYKKSRWSCLFFVLYVLVAVYFLTNLILAVVYDSFKSELAKQVIEMDSTRRRILEKAFNLIDIHRNGHLNKEQCVHLFEELNKYRSLPKTKSEDFELVFDELDDSGDFKINLEEFTDLCNAIALRFQKEPLPSWFEQYPSFYHSQPCKKFKAFVQGPIFGYIVAFVLFLNLVAVIIETTLDIQNSSAQKSWQAVEFFFGWLYVLEMALKIFSYGFDAYWMEGQNRFDFIITWIIVIGETATFCVPSGLALLSNGEWIRYLLLARMLRLIRLLLHVNRYKAFVATFLKLIPSLMPYLGTIFCVLCIYCTLGLQLFGGLVNAGNPILETTDLYDNDYLLFNFNDYPNGMVTLFNLLVMGNWQVWMQSYKELTGTSWSLAYFISFYLLTVLLLLNLVVAFVLEAFFAEMELETTNESEDDQDASRRKDRRRHVGFKTRSRTVDTLLHRILSSELSESQRSKS
ncbi:two pore calcium channel protein 1 [Dioscorea cayenensis subsp. rotundata]|uniref:Two pore calcium channel protein 1 n=1 Tax=Dioscorea cayennensis subsp. rotundata TaxID=55577 RepID=A0AB40ARG9_DIOCR|nr:two pore calcium channel protein 1 [Dioscorea cayenensis subsp. rotundata]